MQLVYRAAQQVKAVAVKRAELVWAVYKRHYE